MKSDLKLSFTELTPCCNTIVKYQHHYYLTGRDLRGETYGEWFEYLATITKLSHATIYRMHEQFRYRIVGEDKHVSLLQEHAINESFEEDLFKYTEFKLK